MLCTCLIQFYTVPNNFVLGILTLLGILLPSLSILFSYLVAKARSIKKENDSEDKIAIYYGFFQLKFFTLLNLIVTGLLLNQVGEAIPPEGFWSRQALTTSWWCVFRVCGASFLFGSSLMFDAHFSVRLLSLLLLPGMGLISFISEIDIATKIECIEQEICTELDPYNVKLLAWRELVNILLILWIWILSIWLGSMFGLCMNDFVFQREEHQELHSLLNDDDEESEP